ncbi:MAG: hypothetical protein NZM04_11180 [Methylacidiphilales bacterium]|nr:hypothetical protein [Candidatus Methylacidiphilales bacterium]
MCEPPDPAPDGSIPKNPTERQREIRVGNNKRHLYKYTAKPRIVYSVENPTTCTAPCGQLTSCPQDNHNWTISISMLIFSITVDDPGGPNNSYSGWPIKKCEKLVIKAAMQLARVYTEVTEELQVQIKDPKTGIYVNHGYPKIRMHQVPPSPPKEDGYKFTECKTYCES